MPRSLAKACACLALAALASSPAQDTANAIPSTVAVALDNHKLTLPNDLPARANILILGFGRHSADATTAWEKSVRQQLARPPAIAFYDIAMLAEVPGFVRPMVIRAIRHEVPEVLHPNFLVVTDHEDVWKRIAGYTPDQPDAAYLLLVDHTGHVRWSTHQPYSATTFATLKAAAEQLAIQPQ